MTDSGGIQEEVPSLGKPVIVMRTVTERIEGIKEGTAKLVGTNKSKIVSVVSELIDNKNSYKVMSRTENPYGDGKTSEKILRLLMDIMIN